MRTSFTEHRTLTQAQATQEVRVKSRSSFTRKVHFTDAREQYDCSSGDETMSGESDTFEPVQDVFSGERWLKCCPGSRIQNDLGTEYCPGSRETSQTDWNMMVGNHTAQVMTRGPSPGTTHLRQLPILMYRRLRFITCWWTRNSAGWTENASGSGQRQVHLRLRGTRR